LTHCCHAIWKVQVAERGTVLIVNALSAGELKIIKASKLMSERCSLSSLS